MSNQITISPECTLSPAGGGRIININEPSKGGGQEPAVKKELSKEEKHLVTFIAKLLVQKTTTR